MSPNRIHYKTHIGRSTSPSGIDCLNAYFRLGCVIGWVQPYRVEGFFGHAREVPYFGICRLAACFGITCQAVDFINIIVFKIILSIYKLILEIIFWFFLNLLKTQPCHSHYRYRVWHGISQNQMPHRVVRYYLWHSRAMSFLWHSWSRERLQDGRFQRQMSRGLYDSGYVSTLTEATIMQFWHYLIILTTDSSCRHQAILVAWKGLARYCLPLRYSLLGSLIIPKVRWSKHMQHQHYLAIILPKPFCKRFLFSLSVYAISGLWSAD